MIQKKIDKIVKKYNLSKKCEAEIKRLTVECLIEGSNLSKKRCQKAKYPITHG